MSNHYNSLQAKFEHRFNHGFSALVAYTWSKVMQYNQASALGGNTAYEYALAPFDIPHNVAISGSYQLPFGRGRAYMNNTQWLRRCHRRRVAGADDPRRPQRNAVYADHLVGSREHRRGIAAAQPESRRLRNPNFQRSLAHWFDKSRYACRADFTYGQVRANTLRAGTYNQFDASVFKNFSLPGESTLSFRAEFFNFPNTTSFNAPSNAHASTMPPPDRSPAPPTRRDNSVCAQVQLLIQTRTHLLQFAHFKKQLFSCVLVGAAPGSAGAGGHPSRAAASTQSPATISVDMASKVGPYKPIYSWFGYDEANYTTMRNGKALLRELARPEPRARLHPRASPAHLRRRQGRAEVQLNQRLHRRRQRQARLRLQNPRRHLRRVQSRGRSPHG